MKLSIFTLCDYAQSNNGKITLVGAFNRIFSNNFPFTYQQGFALVARILFTEPVSDSLTVSITDSNGNNIVEPIHAPLTLKLL